VIAGSRELQFLTPGQTETVNWRRVVGPAFVIRGGRLVELSIGPFAEVRDKGTYMLAEGTQEFEAFHRSLPSREDLMAARIGRERVRVEHANMIRAANQRLDSLVAIQHVELHDDAIKRANQEIQARSLRTINAAFGPCYVKS
jgi:hypothetical protein